MPDPPSHRNTYAEKLWEPYKSLLGSPAPAGGGLSRVAGVGKVVGG